MADQDNITLTVQSSRSTLEDLAAELSVDIEALEERLEMVAIDFAACCIVNGAGCHVSKQ